jgi:hypothetical protein
MSPNCIDDIVEEVGAFVQYLVEVYTNVYELRAVNQSENGCLLKKENVFNMIMGNIFKKPINRFIRNAIRIKHNSKITKFGEKLKQLKGKDL